MSAFAHIPTDLYHAGWSTLNELLMPHPVCRHDTYPVTIFHITFYLPRLVCVRFTNRVLVCRRLLIYHNQSHNYISPSWVCSGENDTEYPPHPPNHNSVHATQYYSRTAVNICLSHQPQKLYNPMIAQRLSFHVPVSCLQFLRCRRTPDWCRSQLPCLVIPGLVKTSDITV